MRPILSHVLACIIIVIGLTELVYANSKASINDYGQLPSTSQVEVSPSGQLIAFRKTENDKDMVFVFSLKDQKVLRITDVSAINPKGLFFTSDNQLILWASEYRRISGYIGQHNVSAAFRLTIDSGEIEQLLVPGKKIHKGQTNVGRIVGVSSDGKNLFMPAYVGSSASDQTPNYSLMSVNIDNPKKVKRIERGTRHTDNYFLDKNSKPLVMEEYNNKTNVHQISIKKDDQWQSIFEVTTPIPFFSVEALTPDEKHLVLLLEDNKHDKTGYQLLSLETGKISSTAYTRNDTDIERVFTTLNRIALGIQYSGFSPSYVFFDADIDKFVQSVVNKFPEHSVWITSYTPNWSHVVVKVEGSQYAGEYYLFDRSLKATYIATERPNIKPEQIHPIATLKYTASDDLSIPALLTIPKTKVNTLKNLPLVVMPHGGPNAYDRLGFQWDAQALANEGYLVFQPQFRGSEGFGSDFVRAGWGEWGKKMQSDITEGVQFLIEKGYANKDRICIFGWSYGGYAALMGGAQTPELYKCVVAGAAVTDLETMLATEKRDYGRDSWVLDYWKRSILNGETKEDHLGSMSPASLADNFKAPVLLIHGENDKIVPYKQSKIMRKALRKADKSVKLIKLDNDNHHLVENETRVQALSSAVNFINKHIGQ